MKSINTENMKVPPRDQAPERFVDRWGRHWRKVVSPRGEVSYSQMFNPADKQRLDAMNERKPTTVEAEKADGRDKPTDDPWKEIK